MPDILAIVSKAVFEKEAGGRKPGKVWAVDAYHSANKALSPLATGGRLFMVTVRPPKESLWLVAVLENPTLSGKGWRGGRNRVPITDITSLIPRITFANGKGISANAGALGMSLQTPRVLDSASSALLFGAAWSSGVAPPVNLTKHDDAGPLPCLCKNCLQDSSEKASARGMTFVRSSVESHGRVLHYWLPSEIERDSDKIARAVRLALGERLAG